MKEVAYFLRGKVRKITFLSIVDKPKTAKMISKDLSKHRSSISRVLLELEKRGYAKCENPEDDKFRFYSITNKGRKVIDKINKYE